MATKKRGRGKYAATDKRAPELEDVKHPGQFNRSANEENDEQAPAKDAKDDDLVGRYREEYEAAYNKDRENQDEAYRDLNFIADTDGNGGQWDAKALQERTDEGRPVLTVNQCPQFVRQVTGDMRQLKPAIKVVPVDDNASQQVAAKVLPGMIRYIEQRSGAEGIYFAAADQQAGCGIGHWAVTHEYAAGTTFNQEIRITPIPDGVAVVWDPDSVMPDRSDAMFCFVPVDMSRRVFKRKYPGKSGDQLSPSSSEAWTSWFTDDHVRVAEYFYKEPEKQRLALYPDGKIDNITGDDEAEAVATTAGAAIEERDGFCVYRALISQSDVLEKPEKWPGPDIPIVPVIGEEIVIGRKVVRRGVVRVLRDIQRIYNYAVSTQTELIALQPKSPFIGTREQFEKYQDQWETANSRNWPYLEYTHVVGVPPPQRSQPPVASSGLDELMTRTQEAMNATTGIYPAALGAKSNETSGRAIMARQREGDTGTFVYISNFARALRRTGQIIVNMIPQIYDTKRVIQIVGEDGKIDQLPINQPGMDAQGMGPGIGLNDVTIGAYEVALEMGPSFSSKREESREGMTEMLRTLGPGGAQMFLDLFIKAQDWPLADKIAERAKELLPPHIRAKEAAEAGEPPPPPPPPQPPSPEQQQAMELEQQKAQEEQQKNIEMARKNELADAQLQLDVRKLALEGETLEPLAALQAALRQEQAKNAELARNNELDELKQQVAIHQMELEIVKLMHEGKVSALTGEAAQSEEMQKNIELARKNEIDDRKLDLEFKKVEAELAKLKREQDVESEEGQAAQAEKMQSNIELARKSELDERRQQLEFRKMELEELQGQRAHEQAMNTGLDDRRQEFENRKLDHEELKLVAGEMQSTRDHELAMNPAPEPPAAAAKGEGDLEERVDALTEVVMELTQFVQALVGRGGRPGSPEKPPDYIPQLLDIIKSSAARPKPIGTKRTPDGMQVIYDEPPPELSGMPPPELPPPPDGVPPPEGPPV